MSNIEGLNQPNTTTLYAPYTFGDSSFQNLRGNNPEDGVVSKFKATKNDNVFTRAYYIPLESVQSTVFKADIVMSKTKQTIENNLLSKIYVDPYIDPDLERAHFRVWDQVGKLTFKKRPKKQEEVEPALVFASDVQNDVAGSLQDDIIDTTVPPVYICFDELVFAEKNMSSACRKLLREYHEVTSQSTFSYFYQIRKLLGLLMNELDYIKQSLVTDFGEQYENESQQQIALQYESWAKAALHYTRRITKIISTPAEQLPGTEVDQISKKQAAQFQAFFAIRLNAVDSEINDILESLKKDLVDNSEVFYTRYLAPALNLDRDVSQPFDFDFITTDFQKANPVLASELLVATNVLKGNFVSIHADMIERYRLASEKIDGLLMLIHEKKRYANFITQLSNKAVQKINVLKNVGEEYASKVFRSVPVDVSHKDTMRSSHADLDDVDEDCHPQYLLKDGGTVTGNISVDPGITIDGVDLSAHRHTGTDGSAKISILDIDHSTVKAEATSAIVKPMAVTIEGFVPDVRQGGVPVVDTVIAIEIDDDVDTDGYEYEILYTEIEN